MENFELVFIPSPGLSHLISTVEMAKLLLRRDGRLSITILTMQLPNDTTVDDYYATKISNTPSRLTFTALPSLGDWTPQTKTFIFEFIDNQITHVREIISDLIDNRRRKLAGLVLDMFCLNFIDVAREFRLPAYVFFTSGACTLGLFRYVVSMKFDENKDLSEYKNSQVGLPVSCFSLPLPAKLLPSVFFDSGPVAEIFLNYFKKISETDGVVVNTFYELESYGIDSISSQSPKIYPVGPILDLSTLQKSDNDDVKKWLDDQPEKSVIFLCFGTMGSFEEAQVREIALALENSGCRFLWSLRKPGERGPGKKLVVEYDNFEEVLPEGFLERTKGVGKVIGWASQVAVLSHAAVGGFISHCGWNSTLESIWFGVPIATFPMYAEQQVNAFLLVEELGMAEVVRLDYCVDFKGERTPEIVGAEEIEAAIRRVMAEEGGGVRGKVEEMQRKGRAALEEGGSSYNAQTLFIEDVISNIN